jgi:hypothetical protein
MIQDQDNEGRINNIVNLQESGQSDPWGWLPIQPQGVLLIVLTR